MMNGCNEMLLTGKINEEMLQNKVTEKQPGTKILKKSSRICWSRPPKIFDVKSTISDEGRTFYGVREDVVMKFLLCTLH